MTATRHLSRASGCVAKLLVQLRYSQATKDSSGAFCLASSFKGEGRRKKKEEKIEGQRSKIKNQVRNPFSLLSLCSRSWAFSLGVGEAISAFVIVFTKSGVKPWRYDEAISLVSNSSQSSFQPKHYPFLAHRNEIAAFRYAPLAMTNLQPATSNLQLFFDLQFLSTFIPIHSRLANLGVPSRTKRRNT